MTSQNPSFDYGMTQNDSNGRRTRKRAAISAENRVFGVATSGDELASNRVLWNGDFRFAYVNRMLAGQLIRFVAKPYQFAD